MALVFIRDSGLRLGLSVPEAADFASQLDLIDARTKLAEDGGTEDAIS